MRKSGKITALQRDRSRASSGKLESTVNAATKHAELFVYGTIGDDFFGEGVTANAFRKELRAIGRGVKTLDLRINSDGGVVTEARAMYALLLDHPAKITVYVDGIAASAASFLAMVGDRIVIADGAYMMIHNARVVTRGTADELREMAATLDIVSAGMLDTYAARTGQAVDDIRRMMDAETWFSAADAVENGFADEIAANKGQAVAVTDNLRQYANTPAALRPSRGIAAKILKGLME